MGRRKETGLREKVEGGEWKGRRGKKVAEKCKMVSLNFIHHVSRSAILHAQHIYTLSSARRCATAV